MMNATTAHSMSRIVVDPLKWSNIFFKTPPSVEYRAESARNLSNTLQCR